MDGQATSLGMWRQKLPPLLCLAWLQIQICICCECLSQGRVLVPLEETCLSPCFASQASPSQRERFRQRPSIPTKSLGSDESTFSAENTQPVVLAEVQGHSQQFLPPPQTCPEHADVSPWICVTSCCYLDGSLVVAFAFGSRANKGSLCPTALACSSH